MRIFKSPTMTNKLHAQATTVRFEDGVTCPVCGASYSKRLKDGSLSLYRPCKHLVAHLGPFGWERSPDAATAKTTDFAAVLAFEHLAANGLVTRVTSHNNEIHDEDWLVWSRPACTALARPCDVAAA